MILLLPESFAAFTTSEPLDTAPCGDPTVETVLCVPVDGADSEFCDAAGEATERDAGDPVVAFDAADKDGDDEVSVGDIEERIGR